MSVFPNDLESINGKENEPYQKYTYPILTVNNAYLNSNFLKINVKYFRPESIVWLPAQRSYLLRVKYVRAYEMASHLWLQFNYFGCFGRVWLREKETRARERKPNFIFNEHILSFYALFSSVFYLVHAENSHAFRRIFLSLKPRTFNSIQMKREES